MTRLNFLVLLLLGLFATLVSATNTAHDTTKRPTASKPTKGPKPSKPTKAPKPPKPEKEKPCTKMACEGSMRKASSEVGRGYKSCSNRTCGGLYAWSEGVKAAGFPLTAKYASLSTAVTVPKTNCTGDRAKVCSRMLKRVRKVFQKAVDTACTNVTCPPLTKGLAELKKYGITFVKG